MKKILILSSVLALAFLVSSDLRSQDNTSTRSVEVKDYPMAVTNNTNNRPSSFAKVLTPQLIQEDKHVPDDFPVFSSGKVEGVELMLIDQNKNGSYDEIGTDLMVFDKSRYGVPVSSVINLKNKLYECKVDPKGVSISLKPYEGKCNELDLLGGFKCPTGVDLLIVNSGDIYINVAGNKKALVPVGSYNLWLGYIEEGTSHAAIKQNQMKPIEVAEAVDKDGKIVTTSVQWGASFRFEFNFSVDDYDKVKVTYKSIRVFGSADEEYYNFSPKIFPQVEVLDGAKTQVSKGAFCVG
ncbi:MAG: hypothetical protein HZA49_01810 [Planctomycetes bacterium]|nr:hypothetical protein [Planctomycetota bacterium]